jgi:FlaA1/EpsC-like NDP-sugar epimerase
VLPSGPLWAAARQFASPDSIAVPVHFGMRGQIYEAPLLFSTTLPDVGAPAFTSALLDRDPEIVYGHDAQALIADRVVLVTGAGGSIGSELVRQLVRLAPSKIYLLDHDESGLHALQLQLHGHGLLDDDSTILCDIRDEEAVRRILMQHRPHIVFHAAAHKHLPLLERYPDQGIKTNVFGTLNLVSAAVEAGVERFVNVSTDKAAQPSSVLGATKRIAELIVAAHAGSGTRVASVRFGNVLGSRGSFLHSLASQIDRGENVTVTDPHVTRYFMTIPEAAGLVIEAAVMADRGETYVLDMGQPVKIMDLVTKYLAITGLWAPGIRFTGLRPGEKMHEALFDSAETGSATGHPKISSVHQRSDLAATVLDQLPVLRDLLLTHAGEDLRGRLMAMTPDPAPAQLCANTRPARQLAHA